MPQLEVGQVIDFPNEESKWAWLAGLVEGEGCISLGYSPMYKRYQPAFVIVNCSRDLLEIAQSIAGGRIYKRKERKSHKQSYALFLTRKSEMILVLNRLLPFLATKKKQAKLLIRFLAQRKSHNIYLQMKKLNRRGFWLGKKSDNRINHLVPEMKALRRLGFTYKGISRELKVGETTVRRRLGV